MPECGDWLTARSSVRAASSRLIGTKDAPWLGCASSPGQRWLDLRAPETREELRAELAALLMTLGLSDLDLSRMLGPQRTLTQAIARWAYDRGYAGLAYASRLDGTLTLWALFERVAFEPVGLAEPITPDDPDLVATARLFGLLV